MQVSVLHTDNLVLRPITPSDSAAIQKIFPRWSVVQYLAGGMPWPYPADGAERMLRDVTLPAVARGEEWAWAITLKSASDTLIGMISLLTQVDDNRGYWLGEEWQGRGLMTEACAATSAFWFERLGFTGLRESKAMANVASRRLSDREGMRLVRIEQRPFVSGLLPAGIWEMSVDDWRERRQSVAARSPVGAAHGGPPPQQSAAD